MAGTYTSIPGVFYGTSKPLVSKHENCPRSTFLKRHHPNLKGTCYTNDVIQTRPRSRCSAVSPHVEAQTLLLGGRARFLCDWTGPMRQNPSLYVYFYKDCFSEIRIVNNCIRENRAMTGSASISDSIPYPNAGPFPAEVSLFYWF